MVSRQNRTGNPSESIGILFLSNYTLAACLPADVAPRPRGTRHESFIRLASRDWKDRWGSLVPPAYPPRPRPDPAFAFHLDHCWRVCLRLNGWLFLFSGVLSCPGRRAPARPDYGVLCCLLAASHDPGPGPAWAGLGWAGLPISFSLLSSSSLV